MTLSRSLNGILAAVALATAAFVYAGEAEGGGFGIGPGMILVENVKPGGDAVDVGSALGGVSLVVSNGTAQAQMFTVASIKPRDAIGKWEMGYEEIPDAAWCSIDKNEIEVPAKTEKKITVTIRIPDKPEYYNRKFMGLVVCSPGKAKQGVVGLRVASRIQIETISRVDVDGTGAGKTALVPSVAVISESLPNLKIPTVVRVRNNSDAARTFTVKHLYDVEPDAAKHERYFGVGYTPVAKPGWVSVDGASFALKPGEAKELLLTVAIPATAEPGKKYEDLVVLQDDKGSVDFARVRVEMAKSK
jgi:hypothetical protein